MRFAGFPFRPGVGSWFFLLVCAVPVSIRGCAGGCIRFVELLRLGGSKNPCERASRLTVRDWVSIGFVVVSLGLRFPFGFVVLPFGLCVSCFDS